MFEPYKSFDEIINIEWERYTHTDAEVKKNLQKLLKKNKNKLEINDWINAIESWGIPADQISDISKIPIPNDLYYQIDLMKSTVMKRPDPILYDTNHLTETENLYYIDHRMYKFNGKV